MISRTISWGEGGEEGTAVAQKGRNQERAARGVSVDELAVVATEGTEGTGNRSAGQISVSPVISENGARNIFGRESKLRGSGSIGQSLCKGSTTITKTTSTDEGKVDEFSAANTRQQPNLPKPAAEHLPLMLLEILTVLLNGYQLQ